MKKTVPSFQHQKLKSLSQILRNGTSHVMWETDQWSFSDLGGWALAENCAAIRVESFFRQNMERCDFMGLGKGCIDFFIIIFGICGRPVQFWASSAGSTVQIPALFRNDSSVQELETNEARKAAYCWQNIFTTYIQLSGCIFPKSFEILVSELLWLHLSVIFFSLTKEFAVSKFYSLGIKIIIHL